MNWMFSPLGWHRALGQGLLGLALLLTLILGFHTPAASATSVYDLPVLGAGSPTFLVDAADVISLANEGRLNNDLKKLAQKTGKEVRFVVIRRLDFEATMDGFTDQLFQTWYPTAEEQASQTLLVLDTLTNSTALRFGEAVKALLSQEQVTSITNETVALPLKEGGKYNQALLAADKRLVAILSGQVDPGPPQVAEISLEGTFATAEETDDRSATLWVVVLLALATLIPMVTYFWYVGLPGR